MLRIRNCGSAAYDWGSCCFLANCLVSKHAKRPFLFLMFGFWLIFLCMKMLLHVTIPISVNTLYKRFIVSEINSKWSRRIKKLSPPACLTKFLGHFKFKKICKSTPNDLKRVKKIADSSPTSAADRWLTFHIDYVITCCHTKFLIPIKLSCWCCGNYIVKFDDFVVLIEKWWNFEKWRNFFKFFGHFSWKKNFCKSTPNGLKRVKNTKPPTRPLTPPPTDFPSRVC